MRVNATRQTQSSTRPGAANAANASGAVFSLGEPKAAPAAASVQGAAPLASLNSLLAVQGMEAPEDALSAPKRAIARAEDMLDSLDAIKIALLGGEVPERELGRLLKLVESRRETLTDPALTGVLDEIELRAQVELAKLGK